MKFRPESGGDLTEGIKRRERDINDRARDMGLVVADKKVVSDNSKDLRLATTREGAEAVKEAYARAAEAANIEYGRQNKDFDVKIGDCKKAERDFYQRMDNARKDTRKIYDAAPGIAETPEACAYMAQAGRETESDAGFAGNLLKRQQDLTRSSEQRRDSQKSQLQSLGVSWLPPASSEIRSTVDVAKQGGIEDRISKPSDSYGLPVIPHEDYQGQIEKIRRGEEDRDAELKRKKKAQEEEEEKMLERLLKKHSKDLRPLEPGKRGYIGGDRGYEGPKPPQYQKESDNEATA